MRAREKTRFFSRSREKSTGVFRGRFPAHSTRLPARHFRLVNRIWKPTCSRIENSIRDTRWECGVSRCERHFRRGRRQSISLRRFPRGKSTNTHPSLPLYAIELAWMPRSRNSSGNIVHVNQDVPCTPLNNFEIFSNSYVTPVLPNYKCLASSLGSHD